MKNKLMTCDDEDHAIDIFPIEICDLVDDSDGNLRLNWLVTHNPFDEMTAPDMKDKPIVYWRKERLVDLPLGDFAPQYIFDDMDISYQEDLHLLHTEMNASHVINQEIRKLTTGGYVLFLFVVSAVLWWLSKFKYGRHIIIGISLKGNNMMTDQTNYTTNQTKHIDRTQWWKRTIVGDIQYITNTRDNPADGGFKRRHLGESCTRSKFIEQWDYTAVRTNLAALKIHMRKITVNRMNSILGN